MINRRHFAAGAMATGLLAACSNSAEDSIYRERKLNMRADATVQNMLARFPETSILSEKAAGLLIMPVLTEVGLIYGGSYGQGVLRVKGETVDYYSAASAGVGLQIGAQQYSHVLFFMTEEALNNFRNSSGWSADATAEYAVSENGDSLNAGILTSRSPIIAVLFAQAGLRFAATLEGVKYTRIAP